MMIVNLILGVLLGLFVIWLLIVLIRLVIWLLVRKIKHSIGDRSRGFENSLVELALKWGTQNKDQFLVEIIRQAKELIAKDPNLLSLSSVWTDLIEHVKEVQSKESQHDFFRYIFTNAKFPNPEKLAKYLVELININFFNPPRKPDRKVLENLANDSVREFSLYSYNQDGEERHYKIVGTEFIEDDWAKAISKDRNLILSAPSCLPDEIRETLQESDRKKYLDAVGDIIFGAIWGADVSGESSSNSHLAAAKEVAGQIARLVMMDDLIKEEEWPKIHSYYMEMYKLGVWPIGIVETKDENKNYVNKFAVFIPPVTKKQKPTKFMPFYERLWHVNKDFAKALGKSR